METRLKNTDSYDHYEAFLHGCKLKEKISTMEQAFQKERNEK